MLGADASIQVAVRARPLSSKEVGQLAPTDEYAPFLGDGALTGGSSSSSTPLKRAKYLRSIIEIVDDKVLIFDPPEANPVQRFQNSFAHGNRRAKDMRYAFDRVFGAQHGQRDVFEGTSKPLLDGLMNGYNATVFAYGATGCGKTHTISGTPEDPGLVFLTMEELFNRIEDVKDEQITEISLSYLEIYNETIRDLLSPTPTTNASGLALREDSANKISVNNLTEHRPSSPQEVLNLIHEGNNRRTMSPTQANAVSSRSHAVLQINITQQPRTADVTRTTTSATLSIIDLAGSERASATTNMGMRMKEGANINKSLLALGNCINALCESGGRKGGHIPYRDSKLTRLLKFSLGGNCKTVMIVCISPISTHYDETRNTLQYANRAKNIKTKVSRNLVNVERHVAQYVQAIYELRKEVEELKAKLADRVAAESDADRRRKAEMRREYEGVKRDMCTRTDQVIRSALKEGVAAQARVAAAEARLRPLRKRIQSLDEEIASRTSNGQAAPADVEAERALLQELLQRELVQTTESESQRQISSLSNTINLHDGALLMAHRNNHFDEETAEAMREQAKKLTLDREHAALKIRYERMMAALEAEMDRVAMTASIGARATVALKDAAGVLEVRAAAMVNEDGREGQPETSASLRALAETLRAVSKTNDEAFIKIAGKATVSPPRPSAAQGAKATLASSYRPHTKARASIPPASHAAPATTRSTAATARSRRPSAVVAVASSPAPTRRTVRSSSSVTSPYKVPSPAKRRPRMSSSGRRLSGISPPSFSRPSLQPAAQKKAFRWADEAGEGAIDDGGKGGVHRSGHMPNGAQVSSSGSSSAGTSPGDTASSEADDSSGSIVVAKKSSEPSSASVSGPGNASDADGSSTGEWEDASDVNTPSNNSSTGLGSSATAKAHQPSVHRPGAASGRAIRRSSLFSVGGIGGGKKRAGGAANRTIGSIVEDAEEDKSLDRTTPKTVGSVARAPFSVLGNNTPSLGTAQRLTTATFPDASKGPGGSSTFPRRSRPQSGPRCPR